MTLDLKALLDRLDELEAKATKGPWNASGHHVGGGDGEPPFYAVMKNQQPRANAAFIAALRNAFMPGSPLRAALASQPGDGGEDGPPQWVTTWPDWYGPELSIQNVTVVPKADYDSLRDPRDDCRKMLEGEHDAHMECHARADKAEAEAARLREELADADKLLETVRVAMGTSTVMEGLNVIDGLREEIAAVLAHERGIVALFNSMGEASPAAFSLACEKARRALRSPEPSDAGKEG